MTPHHSLTRRDLAFTPFAALFLALRVRIELARTRLTQNEEDAIDLGLDARSDA